MEDRRFKATSGQPVAVIRAAGRGQRMGEITKYFQKCVLPIDGVPLIVHWVDALRTNGIRLRHIIWGYRGDQVINAVQTYEDGRLADTEPFTTSSIDLAPDGIWEGTASMLQSMRIFRDRPILLCYADNFSSFLSRAIEDILLEWDELRASTPTIDALISLILNNSCSKMSDMARLGGRINGESLLVTEYWTGSSATDLGWAWSGMGIFAQSLFTEFKAAKDPVDVIQALALQGRLAGIFGNRDYCDIAALRAKEGVSLSG